jgi:hypothetical protein
MPLYRIPEPTLRLLPSSDRGGNRLVRVPCGVTRLRNFKLLIFGQAKVGPQRAWREDRRYRVRHLSYSHACTVFHHSFSRHPDLLEPHILRSLSNVKAVSVHTSCAGCHAIVLDVEGTAWLFGRNQLAALGVPSVDAISENAPHQVRAIDLGAPPGTVFVNAACGRSHSILIGSNGRVWTAGLNSLGQVRSSDRSPSFPTPTNCGCNKCGHTPCPEVSSFKLVNGPLDPQTGEQEHVDAAAAGITFTLFLTSRGKST